MGPFDQWPTGGGGFEYFYGFIGGETNQWYPAIYEGTTPMEQGKSPEEGYHFTEDMTNKAIGWVRQQKALMPDKPFFMYFAPGATHAPHHVPKEWIDKYKGKFDGGWDKLREETFARQKKLGVIPGRCGPHQAARRNPRLRRHAGGAQADPRARDGGLRRRSSSTPTTTSAGCSTRSKDLEILDDTLDLLHLRRQRRLRRRHAERLLQRGGGAQRHGHARDARIPDEQDRRLRRAGRLQPLRGRLGACDEHALSVDQAGGVALWRHAQRHDRALAQGHQGARARSGRSSVT